MSKSMVNRNCDFYVYTCYKEYCRSKLTQQENIEAQLTLYNIYRKTKNY